MPTEYELFLILSDCHGTEIAEALMARRKEIAIKQRSRSGFDKERVILSVAKDLLLEDSSAFQPQNDDFVDKS